MFKPLITLMRGSANRAVEAAVDANALTILDQQIRESTAAIEKSRKTLALAIAQERQKLKQLETLKNEIADLESRAREALKAGRDDLAGTAAETIASLENEYEAASRAQQAFAEESQRLRTVLRTAERRLRDLEHGRRIARTNEATLKLRDQGLPVANSERSSLSEAEAALARLQDRQRELADATSVLEELHNEESPESLSKKMADAGFGAPSGTRAQDVLKRLEADLNTGEPRNRPTR